MRQDTAAHHAFEHTAERGFPLPARGPSAPNRIGRLHGTSSAHPDRPHGGQTAATG